MTVVSIIILGILVIVKAETNMCNGDLRKGSLNCLHRSLYIQGLTGSPCSSLCWHSSSFVLGSPRSGNFAQFCVKNSFLAGTRSSHESHDEVHDGQHIRQSVCAQEPILNTKE